MGEIRIPVILENLADRVHRPHDVRTVEVSAIVDTGAVMTLLPQDMVDYLGLIPVDSVVVTYADERKEKRPVAGPVLITIQGRSTGVVCIVGPPLSEPLIGQVVLESLDLLADCVKRELRPRPESPYMPLIKMK